MTQAEPEKKSKKAGTVLIILISLGILIFLAFNLSQFTTAPILSEPEEQEEVRPAPEPLPAAVKDPEVQPAGPAVSDSQPIGPPTIIDPCQQTIARMALFFEHLDSQEYIAAYQLKRGAKYHFNLLAKKLFTTPPVIVRETDNLFAILNNMTHFFRVIGKWNVFLIKDILDREAADIENLLGLFYQWSEIAGQCRPGQDSPELKAEVNLPLDGLYEYAGFFLNTMGGQSYLFRRESRIRQLVKYYSVLIIDRANEAKINRHGIDIRYPVDSLIQEMENQQILTNKNLYLEKLYGLQEKYRVQYGAAKEP